MAFSSPLAASAAILLMAVASSDPSSPRTQIAVVIVDGVGSAVAVLVRIRDNTGEQCDILVAPDGVIADVLLLLLPMVVVVK